MRAEAGYGEGGGSDPLPLGAPEAGYYLGLQSSCPPEYADVPIGQLMDDLDAQQQAGSGSGDEVLPAAARGLSREVRSMPACRAGRWLGWPTRPRAMAACPGWATTS
jgi:hypothetical protein